MDALYAWLQDLGLERYARVFAQNDVDLEALRLLTDAELEKLGVSLGHRKKLLRAIAELSGTQAPTATPGAVRDQLPFERPLGAEAERRQLTVMFCDLVGSTQLSQQLDPEQLRELMRAYQQACGAVIESYSGHVAQYLGDGLMVYFGWPGAHEDDAERALRAGLEIVAQVKAIKASSPLQVRIGIATGSVVVGETGAGDASVPKAAVGETPNLAARMQALANADQIVIASSTRRLVGAAFDCQDLGSHTLKGIVEPVHAWRVLGLSQMEGRFEASHAGGLSPLVAREEELALLLRRWEQTKEGEGQVVLLSGEPGIGKSRIVRALRERIASPHTRLRYQCSAFHTKSALHPVIEHLERTAGFEREDSVERKLDKLEALLLEGEADTTASAPLIAALLSLPTDRYPPLNLSPQKQKERTLETLIGQMLSLSRKQPVLMIIEDVHWIDPTFQELLDLTLPRIAHARILMVLTYRTEYVHRWEAQTHVTALMLNRLGGRASSAIIAELTGGKALPPEVLKQILAKTDGVPLFVEELTKTVLEARLLLDAGDHYELTGPLPSLAIPSTLQDSLMARLDRLAPVKEVAQLAACIGREFSYEMLTKVSPLSASSLQDALLHLGAAELVFARGLPPDATYTFKHALVQDAAYDSLLKTKRIQLHAQIAEVLEKDFPERAANEPEVLAFHLTQAGLHRQAVEYWQRAGTRALQRSAMPEAIAHLREGLAVLPAIPESDQRFRLELALQTAIGGALIATKGFANPEVAHAFRRAQELCRHSGDAAPLFPVLMGLWIFHQVRFEHELAREITDQCVALAEREGERGLLAEAHRAAGTVLCWLGRGQTARQHFERSLACYDRAQHDFHAVLYGQNPAVGTLCWFAITLWVLGFPDQALARVEEARRVAHDLKHPFSQAWARLFGAFVRSLRKEWAATLQSAEACIALSTEQRFPAWVALASVYKARALARLGQPQQAIDILQQTLAAFEAVGEAQGIPFFLTFLADAYVDVGRVDEALQAVDDALARTKKNSGHWCESLLHLTKGDALLKQRASDETEAQICFQRAIDVARDQQAKSFELQASVRLAQLWKSQGKRREAHDLLAQIYSWFTEGFDTKDLKEAEALLEELG